MMNLCHVERLLGMGVVKPASVKSLCARVNVLALDGVEVAEDDGLTNLRVLREVVEVARNCSIFFDIARRVSA